MCANDTPYDPTSIERLAQIINRARADNGVLTEISREDLSSDLAAIGQIFSTPINPPKDGKTTPWDLIREETPTPSRSYKIFAKALATDDPIAALRTLSRDRSPSELYLLQIRINSRARSKRPRIETDLPKLNTAHWSDLSEKQREAIRDHMMHLELFYRKTQSKVPNPEGLLINEAILELACIFTVHTHFDGIDTDLPHTATSRFVKFLRLALLPFVAITRLTPGAISKRWGRLKGFYRAR